MPRYLQTVLFLPFLCIGVCSAQTPGQILQESGIRGGLIVHLGCGDGKRTVEFYANDRYLVHGLDTDPRNVSRARRQIAAKGLYGTVSVDTFDGIHLPYIDNLVNLLVAEDLGNVSMDEVMRILCPGGVAYIRREGKWSGTVKAWPSEIDEWTHYMHGPDNNAVANDTVIDSPRRLQWNGGPKWTRSHETMSSMNAMVSAGGRIFYVMDEGPSASVQLPPEWKLIARDAFNGVTLWKREIPLWQTHLWPVKAGPATIPRRLVAIGGRVYVTLGLTQPVTALDAATGLTVKTYEGTEGTEEILVSDGVLYLRVNEDFKPDVFKPENEHCWTESIRAMGTIGVWKPSERQYVAAIDANSGKELWRVDSPIARLTLTVDTDSVYFHTGQHIVSLNRETGKEQWRQDNVPKFTSLTTRTPPTLVSYDDVLLYEHDRVIVAYSRKRGERLWQSAHPRSGHVSPGDALVINDLVWSAGSGAGKFIGKDIHTGQVKAEFSPPEMTWFHPRCYRSKGTTRYLLASRTGIEVVDVRAKKVDVNHWTRGACLYGIMPANGLIYTGPHSCACLLETKTSGFNALAPAKPARDAEREIAVSDRLEKGPAYSDNGHTSTETASAWPMYRHDRARSGCTPISVPTDLKKLWTAGVNDRLTSLVSGHGILMVATPETHTVHALDTAGGRTIWTYTCGGRVDSPPTLYGGRVYFGSHDGYVNCLRASDGCLVWRFLAARNEQRIVSYGQVESVWPVHGSVLVMNDVVYCVAGRSAFLDGGLRFYKLNAETGELLAMSKIDEKAPDTGENLQNLQAGWCGLTMPVANPDILTSDGKHIFMGSQGFGLDGSRLRVVPDLDVQQQDRPGAHLFSPVGLLDDNWHHRSYWMYGVTSVYGWHVWFEGAKHAPSGRTLSFDENTVYGFARKPQFLAQAPTIEYQLYKADKRPTADGPARVRRTDSEHTEREWNQTQWLSRGRLYKPDQLTALNYQWITADLPIQVRSMVLTKDALFIAGLPDVIDEMELWQHPDDVELKRKSTEQTEAWKGHRGGSLWAISLDDGSRLASIDLEAPPVFDGMIAADNKLLLSLMNGQILCYGGASEK
ncbi:MAG TPA: PQQ-binding-like beta-propeller repeat protein [Sedimentisphaerales bacterium]|nr:PQQ-binding-like beta-propeller repeat protein [Sedimentisphaerales bacterium]